MTIHLVQQALEVNINFGSDWNYEKGLQIISEYNLARDSLELFLKGEITLEEYLERLDSCTAINIDSYLDLIEDNLIFLGI